MIFAEECSWDDLNSNRTRKNILLEIESGGKKLIHLATLSAWPNLSPWVSLLTSVGPVHTQKLSALGKGGECNSYRSSQETEHRLCRDKYKL